MSLIENDLKHNDIVCAAISEFSEKGMLATTMEAIAKRAGVSKRTLYKHYANKEMLLDVVIDLLLERLSQFKAYQYDAKRPLLEQLKEVAQVSLQLNSDEDFLRLSRMVIIESMRSEEVAQRINRKFIVCEQGSMHWFADAAAAGALGNADPNFIAAIFYGVIKKVSYWDQAIKWQAPITPEQEVRLIDDVCRLIGQYIESS